MTMMMIMMNMMMMIYVLYVNQLIHYVVVVALALCTFA